MKIDVTLKVDSMHIHKRTSTKKFTNDKSNLSFSKLSYYTTVQYSEINRENRLDFS